MIELPRELVLASAGTGKTYRISSRVIGLLAAGAAPESIFASTFTRKAAGEILDRVLVRLAAAALDERAARELAGSAALAPGHLLEGTPAAWMEVLRRLLGELHRANVGTLDSFFVRAAASFAEEVGLPPEWSIADATAMEGLRGEALNEVLTRADAGVVVELVRAVTRAEAGRSVHDALLRQVARLLELHHAVDPAIPDPWGGLAAVAAERPAPDAAARAALAERFRALEVPATRGGTPNQRWASALETAALQVEAGEWEALLASNLCAAAREEAGAFASVPVPAEVCSAFSTACEMARAALANRIDRQARALGRLAGLLAEAMERRQRDRGAYDFADLTRLIGGPTPLATREDLYYRLDARTQHILLDEFQDTSLAQWEALEPLLDELLSGYEGERAAVVVADPKQSIYAWRGGEPRLVRHVGNRFELTGEELHRSWRSSGVVLDVVNEAFGALPENPVFSDDPLGRAVATEWAEAFVPHEPARDLPGYVRLVVGPADEGRGGDRPRLCRRAAELVRDLREETPAASIGVLTRRNRTVARLIMELRSLGIAASEEGGNPLTDSPAVASLLALLRLADHPGDLVSRYHVARTPVAAIAPVEYHDHTDGAAARRLALRIRRRLIDGGYGVTIERLAEQLQGAADDRERRRLAQLVELAYRYDERATLRVSDFLRLVESERVEDPTAAMVRVMTVHQAKGLEFDVVVLPELDVALGGSDVDLLSYRPHPAARVTRAFPYVSKGVRELFPDVPELAAAAEQNAAGRLRDGLSALYVSLTRARHAVHVLLKPDGRNGMGTAQTGSRLLRLALGAEEPAVEGVVLYERGDPRWHARITSVADAVEGDGRAAGPPAPAAVRLAPATGARAYARRTPSELAGGTIVDLRLRLDLESRAASDGTMVHAWLERLRWIEDGLPADPELLALARSLEPGVEDARVAELAARLRSWLRAPAIHSALSRASFPAGAEVECEAPFIHRSDGALVEGVIDRLVLLRENGRVTRATVLDYKTDAVDGAAAIEARLDHYRPQMEAYRRGVAAAFHLPYEAVECRLLFLGAGVVRRA